MQVEEPATVTNMIVVPEYLVKYFFENDSKIIKDIVDKTECKLTVCSKVSTILNVGRKASKYSRRRARKIYKIDRNPSSLFRCIFPYTE